MTIRTLFFYLGAVILGSSIKSAAIGPIDFETAGDLTGNFRLYGNVPDVSHTGPAAGNDYVVYQHNSIVPPGHVGLFDTTPGDGSATQNTFSGNLRVEFDLSASERNSRFGVWFIDPTPGNANRNLLAWFGMDVLPTRDIIRFFKNGDPISGNPPSFGVFMGGTSPTVQSGADVSPDTTMTWSRLTVDYWVDSLGVPTIALTVGTLTAVSSYEASDALPANVEVAFYLLDQPGDGSAKLDNFSITQVPEPSALMLLFLGALPLCRRGRARTLHPPT